MMQNVSGEIAALADKMQHYADEYFVSDEDRYTSVTVFDDGDYELSVVHTFELPDAEPGEYHREEIRYDHFEWDNPRYRVYHRWTEPVDGEEDMYTHESNTLREVVLD